MNAFLSTINLPPIHHKTLKRQEREVGTAVEMLAKKSCAVALDEEVSLASTTPCATASGVGPNPSLSSSACTAVLENDVDAELSSSASDKSSDGELVPCMPFGSETLSPSMPSASRTFDMVNLLAKPALSLVAEACSNDDIADATPVMQNCGDLPTIESASATSGPAVDATGIAISYDMGWQKRGRAHNSLSGVGIAVGVQSGKVVAYETRNKWCRRCHIAKEEGRDPPPHDCRMNYSKSAKSMEADAAVAITESVASSGVAKINQIIGDDDSSTIAKIHEQVDANVEKVSDVTHAKRTLGNHLYAIKKDHKELSDTVIGYFQKMFGYALKQNKNDAAGVRAALRSIVPHAFGDHGLCGSWCGATQAPDSYRHHGLPHGKDLKSDSLRNAMNKEFDVWVSQAARLAPLGSSQPNESLNNTVCSKAPKAQHYSSSESNDFRVACAVAQKNLGYQYVHQSLSSVGLSPGQHCQNYAAKMEKKTAARQKMSNTKQYKARRNLLKTMRKAENKSASVREGTTYSSSCALVDLTEDELTEIPPMTSSTSHHKVPVMEGNLVFYDLETTGLSVSSEITEIAAVCHNGESFQAYVLPKEEISVGATKATGLSVRMRSGKRQLYLGNEQVQSDAEDVVLRKFFQWLDKLPIDNIVLAGHNSSKFDNRVLINATTRWNCTDLLRKAIDGFADTLPAFQEEYPQLKGKCKLSDLAQHFSAGEFSAHSAAEDARILQLISKNLKRSTLEKFSSTVGDGIDSNSSHLKTKQLLATYDSAIAAKALSKAMSTKAAASGLAFPHIALAYKRDGKDGVMHLLSEKSDGKIRVTKSAKIVDTLVLYLQQTDKPQQTDAQPTGESQQTDAQQQMDESHLNPSPIGMIVAM